MKKMAAALALAGMVMIWAAAYGLQSTTVGEIRLSAPSFQITPNSISAKKAVLIAPDAQVRADSIRVELNTQKNGAWSVVKGTATGSVVTHARQTDKKTNTSNVIDSTSRSAVLLKQQNTITLSGDAVVKVQYPGAASPVVVKGDTIVIHLDSRVIDVQGSDEKPAEVKTTLKGGEQPSQPSPK